MHVCVRVVCARRVCVFARAGILYVSVLCMPLSLHIIFFGAHSLPSLIDAVRRFFITQNYSMDGVSANVNASGGGVLQMEDMRGAEERDRDNKEVIARQNELVRVCLFSFFSSSSIRDMCTWCVCLFRCICWWCVANGGYCASEWACSRMPIFSLCFFISLKCVCILWSLFRCICWWCVANGSYCALEWTRARKLFHFLFVFFSVFCACMCVYEYDMSTVGVT